VVEPKKRMRLNHPGTCKLLGKNELFVVAFGCRCQFRSQCANFVGFPWISGFILLPASSVPVPSSTFGHRRAKADRHVHSLRKTDGKKIRTTERRKLLAESQRKTNMKLLLHFIYWSEPMQHSRDDQD